MSRGGRYGIVIKNKDNKKTDPGKKELDTDLTSLMLIMCKAGGG